MAWVFILAVLFAQIYDVEQVSEVFGPIVFRNEYELEENDKNDK